MFWNKQLVELIISLQKKLVQYWGKKDLSHSTQVGYGLEKFNKKYPKTKQKLLYSMFFGVTKKLAGLKCNKKNPAYGQHSALLYVCDSRVPILYHGCCQYHKSMSIPWVLANTMSPCWYHKSNSIPWVFVKYMLPILYHKKYCVQAYRNTNNNNKGITISDLQKYNLQIYKKYKLQQYRNTKYQIE